MEPKGRRTLNRKVSDVFLEFSGKACGFVIVQMDWYRPISRPEVECGHVSPRFRQPASVLDGFISNRM